MHCLKRRLLVVLAVILALSSGVYACGQEVPAQEISTRAIAAATAVETIKFDMNLSMTAETTGGPQPGKMTMSQNGVSYVDVVNREMKLAMSMGLDFPGHGKQDASFDSYVVDGWAYVKMMSSESTEEWLKTRLTDEIWDSQSKFSDQVDFLKSAGDIALLGSEKVDGVDAYLLKITPDMAALKEWALSRQQQSGFDLSRLDLAKLMKTYSIKEWIARDSYLPVKMDISMVMEMIPDDVGVPVSQFDRMTLTLTGNMRFYDYGERVPVDLPPEAQGAQEVSSEDAPDGGG